MGWGGIIGGSMILGLLFAERSIRLFRNFSDLGDVDSIFSDRTGACHSSSTTTRLPPCDMPTMTTDVLSAFALSASCTRLAYSPARGILRPKASNRP